MHLLCDCGRDAAPRAGNPTPLLVVVVLRGKLTAREGPGAFSGEPGHTSGSI